MIRRSSSAIWRVGTLCAVIPALGIGCKGSAKDAGPAPNASGSSAGQTLSEPPIAQWEKTYRELLGEEPGTGSLSLKPPEYRPSCAHSLAADYLKAKFDAKYQELEKELRRTARERVASAATMYEPHLLGHAYRQTLLDNAGIQGVPLGPKPPSATFIGVPMTGAQGAWSAPDADGGVGYAAALRKVDASRFRCKLGGAFELKPSAIAPIPGAAPDQPADLLLCGDLGIVLPRTAVVPKVKVEGARARVEGYEPLPDPASPALREALRNDRWCQAVLEVSGAVRLRRWPTQEFGQAQLSAWGASAKATSAVPTWVVSFDPACMAGASCDARDGIGASSLAVITPGKPASGSARELPSQEAETRKPKEDKAPAEPAPAPAPGHGRWEDAARVADPMTRIGGAALAPWKGGFFSEDPSGSPRVDATLTPGSEVKVVPREADKEPKILKWREELQRTGGVKGFKCTVSDVKLTRAYAAPAVVAAGKALGFDTGKGTVVAIACSGSEETSKDGVVVLVPTHAARAVIDGKSVKELVAPAGGFLDAALGEQLLNVPVGAVLEIAKPPRLARMPAGESAFGARDYAVWVADFTSFRCAHEGVGCELFDGAKLPVIKPSQGFKTCDVAGVTYPPAGYNPAPVAPSKPPLPAPPAVQTRERTSDHAKMVRIPEGVFVRGPGRVREPPSNPSDEMSWRAQSDYSPRLVWLSEFWIDQTEITTAQYDACVQQKGCTVGKTINAGSEGYCTRATPEQKDLPASCVNRAQAEAYCKWAGAVLPTEAQWEKAARGVAGRTYPWGERRADCLLASMSEWREATLIGCTTQLPLAVNARPAGRSPFGVLGMSGGVWEWVADTFGPFELVTADKDPVRSDKGNGVVRGGSWGDQGGDLTATMRLELHPALGTEGTGIRCAMGAEPK